VIFLQQTKRYFRITPKSDKEGEKGRLFLDEGNLFL